jgi:anti-anti-sigma factor
LGVVIEPQSIRRGERNAAEPGFDALEQRNGRDAMNDPDDRTMTAPVITLDENALPAGFVELRSAVASAARSGEPTLVVDISRLDQLSSSALTALLWARQKCLAHGGAVVLRGTSRRNRRMLSHTGLWRVFALETTGVQR